MIDERQDSIRQGISAPAESEIGQRAAAERRRLAAERLPGVVRDLRDLDEYRRRNESVAGTVQSAVNDRYLRANRVPRKHLRRPPDATPSIGTRLAIPLANRSALEQNRRSS